MTERRRLKFNLFLRKYENRCSENTIRNLMNTQGEMIHYDKDIKYEVLNYYKALLGTSTTTLPAINLLVIKQGPVLNREQKRELIKLIITDEVYQANGY